MNILLNHRQAGESATSYRHRRREVAKLVDLALKGKPATHSRDKSHFSGEGRAQPARQYVPGPHPTHKPHKVTQVGTIRPPYGVPEPHIWTVMHPGTLVKAVAK